MKCCDLVGGGQGADAAVLGRDSLVAELVAGFDHRPVRAAVGDQPDLAAGLAVDDRRRQGCPGGLELARQPVEVLLPVLGALAVARFLVVAGAASEVGRQRVLGTGNRAVADAVAVDVLVTLELAQSLQVVGVQDLAALDRLGRDTETARSARGSSPGRGRSRRRPGSGTAAPGRAPRWSASSIPRPSRGSRRCGGSRRGRGGGA